VVEPLNFEGIEFFLKFPVEVENSEINFSALKEETEVLFKEFKDFLINLGMENES